MVRLKDIAEAAGVGVSTVSFALNDKYHKGANISEEKRRYIKSVAARMGYRVNLIARTMVTGNSKVIGFLSSSTNPLSEHLHAIITGMQQQMNRKSYLLKFLYLPERPVKSDYDRIIGTCVEQRLCALICHSKDRRTLSYLQKYLSQNNIPLGIVSNSYLPVGTLHVGSDDAHGVTLAMEHLYGLGHRRIAFVGHSTARAYTAIRLDAYTKFMTENGLEIPSDYVVADADCDELKNKFRSLVHTSQPPTAVFCCADAFAVMLMMQAMREGLRVPEDISFVGFGNFGFSQYTMPALTTVYEPFREMGEAIALKMMALVSGNKNIGRRQTIDSRLIVRGSTSSPGLKTGSVEGTGRD